MSQVVEVKGLDELIKRMQAYPMELVKTMAVAMSASLNIFWENVPSYPKQRPDANYRRTGTLGRSLGSSESGGASGSPSVYTIKSLGQSNFEGRFGTSLDYAPYVIGDTTQAQVHQGTWWTIKTIAEKSQEKLGDLWTMVMEKMAAFLEGKGA